MRRPDRYYMQHMLRKKMYASLKIDARKGEKRNRSSSDDIILLIHSNSLRPLPLSTCRLMLVYSVCAAVNGCIYIHPYINR